MKMFSFQLRVDRRCKRAFTLTELMVAMAVFMLAIAAIIYMHLLGLRLNQVVKTKLGASDDARKAISGLIDQVRSAGIVRIGIGDQTSFTEIAPGSAQQGNAIQIYPSKADTNAFICYYLDSTDPTNQCLKRVENVAGSVVVVASSISNSLVFTSEGFAGNILSNNLNNRVIGLSMQFTNLDYNHLSIGAGSYYDYYQLRTKITRRALE